VTVRSERSTPPDRPLVDKRISSIEAVFDAFGIRDGQTLSFHHHLRNGDAVLNRVLDHAAKRGLRDLTIAASSIFPVHAPLVGHIRSGVVGGIVCDYVAGPVAEAIGAGALRRPLLMQSHGGRARAIVTGELAIDAAFVAAPLADLRGAATGRGGRNRCGPLGYPMVDVDHAASVAVLTDALSSRDLTGTEIDALRVDAVVELASIGDNAGIVSGATTHAVDPTGLAIVDLTVRCIEASGIVRDGFSFQTGAGGISLAISARLGRLLRERNVIGGFVCGGITAAQVALLRAGLVRELLDVQSFDLDAARSFGEDADHRAISAAEYASPIHPRAAVDRLDLVVLGASEIDLDFNVNVATAGNGRIIGGPGGHPDTAEGAGLTIVVTRLVAGGYAKLVERVACVVTPGSSVDLVVTEAGIAVNPARPELAARLASHALPVLAIEDLMFRAKAQATRTSGRSGARVVAEIEDRRGLSRVPVYERS
jgi:citrate lyase subunit alpha/citrate CoA-transferase